MTNSFESLGVCPLFTFILLVEENLIPKLSNAYLLVTPLPKRDTSVIILPQKRSLCLLMSLLLKLNLSFPNLIFKGRTHAWNIRMICSRIFHSSPQENLKYLSQVLYTFLLVLYTLPLPLLWVQRQPEHKLQVLPVHYKFTHKGQNLLSNLCKFQILN